MNSTVTIYYLELKNRIKPEPGYLTRPDLKVVECVEKQYAYNRFLYELVGQHWQWFDKLTWSDKDWQSYAENDNLRTWVAYKKGTPAGYYELLREQSGIVHLSYFGLAPRFIGKGFGGFLLGHAIESAWEWDATSIRVNTCTKDHPAALGNYQARGFEIYKTEKQAPDKDTEPKVDNVLTQHEKEVLQCYRIPQSYGIRLQILLTAGYASGTGIFLGLAIWEDQPLYAIVIYGVFIIWMLMRILAIRRFSRHMPRILYKYDSKLAELESETGSRNDKDMESGAEEQSEHTPCDGAEKI